jgi:hypothetical protein
MNLTLDQPFEPYGDIDLPGLHPVRCRGHGQVTLLNRKPLG